MFGKIIHLRKSSAGRKGDTDSADSLNTSISSISNESEPDECQVSRISHMNFGRESYFGLVSDKMGKGVNVHVSLDPETKLLTRATCSCFRSSTRTYCNHIVSFIKYILRPDTDTGKLKSLGEDFQNSFWYEISWWGYRNFGDSILGFKSQINHGEGGLRISYFDRNQNEILAFMPGERLVEEFLYEFFDVIRKDIDSSLFRRMYGRKLKDPNVPSLRRRPWQYSPSEEEINRRGLKSVRQHLEESLWHKIAKVGFLVSGRSGGEFRFTFLEYKEELTVECYDEEDRVIFRLVPPRNHIGSIIETAESKDVLGTDIYIHPIALKTGYRVEYQNDSSLLITPVIENPDPDGADDLPYIDRTELESQLYGSYYFFPDWGFHKIDVNATGLPPEHFSPQKKTKISAEEITSFLMEYSDLLRTEPGIFIDEELLNRETIDSYDSVSVQIKDEGEKIGLEISYKVGKTSIPFDQIFDARHKNLKFLAHEDKWIDTKSPEFAWMDGLNPEALNGNNLSVGRTEYLRFLAFHDKLEKKFSDPKSKSWTRDLELLKPPGRLPTTKSMKGSLRAYQKNGYGWLWFLYQNEFSGLLCDDMGLGKTHQVMALMTAIYHRKASDRKNLKFLVICPTTVLSHWKDKVMDYCPHLDPYVYHGTDRSFHEAFEDHLLVITSYGIALRDIEMLADFRFELIVLDEIQAIKNKSTKTYAAVKHLNSVCTIGLTGTPIENSVLDLKSLFDVILPGYLLSDSSFEENFRFPIEESADSKSKERLSRMIRPFTLRRKKEQVLTELPPKIEDVRKCSLSEDQIRFYRDIVLNQGRELVSALKDPDKRVPYMHIFAVLNYLKQVCNHPAMLEGDTVNYGKYASGKWDLFTEILDESLGSGQKVVVFSQYVKMLDLIESYLKDHDIRFATIKGHTRKRAEAVREFNTDPNCMVFSASLRASGLGIDLTGGSVVIHYDRWWNSAREEQATDRVHRIGQRRGVQVFKLVTINTLEEKIDRIISEKKKLMESVVKQDDKSLLKHFSRDDLLELLAVD